MDLSSLGHTLPAQSAKHRIQQQQSQQQQQQAGDLLSTFKAAALSLTHLYRTATANEEAARSEGYSAAINDLLALIDSNGDVVSMDCDVLRQWCLSAQSTNDTSTNNPSGNDAIDTASSPPSTKTTTNEIHGNDEALRKATCMHKGTDEKNEKQGQHQPMASAAFTYDAPNGITLPVDEDESAVLHHHQMFLHHHGYKRRMASDDNLFSWATTTPIKRRHL